MSEYDEIEGLLDQLINEQEEIDYERLSSQELVDKFSEISGHDSFEGPEGVRHFMELISTVGDYTTLQDFLMDNPDALSTAVDVVVSGLDIIPEWREALITYLQEEQLPSDEELPYQNEVPDEFEEL